MPNDRSHDALIVFSTAPADVAATLSRRLVEERLAACVQRIHGMRATYVWQGEVHDDDEVLLVIKTRAECYAELEEKLTLWHPYEVPEIVACDVTLGAAPYLAWLVEQTRG